MLLGLNLTVIYLLSVIYLNLYLNLRFRLLESNLQLNLSDCTIRESAIVAVHQRCGYVYGKYIHSDCQLGRDTGCLIDVDNPAVSSSLASLCVAA